MRFTSFHRTMHLDEHQLLLPDSTCRFCGSADRKPVGILQEAPEITLQACTSCHAVSASRMPTAQTLKEYYGEYYHREVSDASDARVTFDSIDKLSRHIFRRAARHIRAHDIRILDFGGGDGALAVALARYFLSSGCENVSISLVDYNKSMTSVHNSRIRLQHFLEIEEVVGEQYDLVVASAVIEHLVHPREALMHLLGVLHKDGIFYARTPYVVPFFRLAAMAGIALDFTYPGHLHDLGVAFWNSILKTIPGGEELEITVSRPSPVETSLGKHFLRTLAAHVFKAPWHILGNRYKLVGGWEVFARKR